jgi:acyl carrier protein
MNIEIQTRSNMENKTIRRTLYRVLRKTGVPRDNIELEASFQDDLNFDQVDWAIFLYYMEDSFNIAINEEDVSRLNQVKDSLELIENNT